MILSWWATLMPERPRPASRRHRRVPVNAPQVSFKAHVVNADAAGLLGSAGDETNIGTEFTAFTGIYGWSETAASDTGVRDRRLGRQ